MAPPFGGSTNTAETKFAGFPGLPEWIDLDIIVPVSATVIVVCVGILVVCVAVSRRKQQPLMNPGFQKLQPASFSFKAIFCQKLNAFFLVEEYAQFYGAMTMNREHMVNMRKDGLPYEEMGYSIGGPPNR